MKKWACVLAAVCVLNGAAMAGEKVLTLQQRVNIWAKDQAKELKKVKFKDAYVTYPDFADRAFDSIDAAGLQTNGSNFAVLAADLQAALTRYKDDVDLFRDKRSTVKQAIDALARELRTAANSATPPVPDTAAQLMLACYAAVADGDVVEKERDGINELAAVVTATSGLDPALATTINTRVAAVVATRGINKNDLVVLADDLKVILDMTK